jgi:hypothetical protein
MEPEPDYQVFVCAYCREEKDGFIFWGQNREKYCGIFCRRKAEEAWKSARETYPADSVSRKAG